MAVLIDTNIFLALVFPRDVHHLQARVAMRSLTGQRIVAAPVLPELFYLTAERMNYDGALQAFDLLLSGGFQIEPLTDEDMARMREIMADYRDNRFDFVDTAIMALAERLHITEIYTFDHRDFGAFRPAHCDYFELLP